MKNIHIVPTLHASNLLLCIKDYTEHKDTPAENSDKKGKFRLGFGKYANIEFYQHQNIHITSDEEIKEGDWFIANNGVHKCIRVDNNTSCPFITLNLKGEEIGHFKTWRTKIILTTDQDLIKDGVQAIDDEFLEWFVKNPSCEEVEVDLLPYDGTKSIDKYWGGEYKILIPKEEVLLQSSIYGEVIWGEVKQETLEEANELEYYFESDIIMLECINEMASTGKVPKRWSWFLSKISDLYKQQKGYSEEEVDRILRNFRTDFLPIGQVNDLVFNEWFKQFKKK